MILRAALGMLFCLLCRSSLAEPATQRGAWPFPGVDVDVTASDARLAPARRRCSKASARR